MRSILASGAGSARWEVVVAWVFELGWCIPVVVRGGGGVAGCGGGPGVVSGGLPLVAAAVPRLGSAFAMVWSVVVLVSLRVCWWGPTSPASRVADVPGVVSMMIARSSIPIPVRAVAVCIFLSFAFSWSD